jgi:RNA polymerase sigma-70 factor (ECF subfamily)
MRPLSDGSAATALFVDDEQARLRTQLVRVAAGDTAALGELFVAFGDLVYQTSLRLVGSRADAEDVTQEVFLRLAGALRGFTGGPSSFPGWIRRVAVRETLMRMRSGRRRREVDVDEVASLVARPDDALNRLTIEMALARLSAEHRTVFLLKEVEGLSHAEIAELVGITVANSEVRLHRARRELRDMLRGST